jgi:hypothetical protein
MIMETNHAYVFRTLGEDDTWPPLTDSPRIDHDRVAHWSRIAMGWAGSTLGGDLLSAVPHLDDLVPHIHMVARASLRHTREYKDGYARRMVDSGLVRPVEDLRGLNGVRPGEAWERIPVKAASWPSSAPDPFGDGSPAPVLDLFGEASPAQVPDPFGEVSPALAREGEAFIACEGQATIAREPGWRPAVIGGLWAAKFERLDPVAQYLVDLKVDLKIETVAAMRRVAPDVPKIPLSWPVSTLKVSPVKPISPSAARAVSLPGGKPVEGWEDDWRDGDVSGQGALELANHQLGRGPENEARAIRDPFSPLGEAELFRLLDRKRAVTIRRRGEVRGSPLSPEWAPARRSVRRRKGAGTLGGSPAPGRGPGAAKRCGMPGVLPPETRADLSRLPYVLSEILSRLGFNAEESQRVWTYVRHRVPGPLPPGPRDRPEAEGGADRRSLRR